MTKALSCTRCRTIRTLHADGRITTCDCGLAKGWWVDLPSSTARFYTENHLTRHQVHVIGFHNGFLQRVTGLGQSAPDPYHRALHDIATNTPGYLFDQARRACWAVVLVPGESADTRWATEGEWAAKQDAESVA